MRRTYGFVTAALMLLLVVLASMHVRAIAQVLTPRPEDVRFEALLNEPIAASGRRGIVAGTSALLIKDRRTGQCFVAVTIGSSMGLSPAACEP